MLKKRYYVGDLLFEPIDRSYDVVINHRNDRDILMLYSGKYSLDIMCFILEGYLDL